jgi:hypothetical protein
MAAHLEGGERARLQMEIESLLIDFSNDRTTLLQAAEFAAHHGLVEFVEAIQARLQHRSDSASSVDLLRCEALLVSGRYAEALASLSISETIPARTPSRIHAVESLRATAYLASGDRGAARAALKPLLDSRQISPLSLEILAARLSALGAPQEAWLVLSRAHELGPARLSLLSRLVELGMELNRIEDLPLHLTALAALPKTSPHLLRVAHHKLGSDLFLFSPERDRALQSVSDRLSYAGTPGVPRFSGP